MRIKIAEYENKVLIEKYLSVTDYLTGNDFLPNEESSLLSSIINSMYDGKISENNIEYLDKWNLYCKNANQIYIACTVRVLVKVIS